jgi:hypothetical protein
VIRGECRNHPTTSAVLVCKVRPLQIHPQGRPPVSVGSGIRRASGAVSATMTTLLYPSSRLPATSDRRQASLGGLQDTKAVESTVGNTVAADLHGNYGRPGRSCMWTRDGVGLGCVASGGGVDWQAGRVASGLLNYVCMRGAIFCSLSLVLVFQGRWTSSRRSSPFLRPSVPESPLTVARLVWMPSKITARECLNDCDYDGLSNSTTLCVMLTVATVE